MKVAIALFVKNEKQDIAAWIAWHFSLGIHKLFIFDDHSTDGTYEIIKVATKLYNIELYQTNIQDVTHFYKRQGKAYDTACQLAIEQKYDWLGFLDGDEYLSFEQEQTVQDFLSQFEAYNGVALNWRIYGSSHRALKTYCPPYEAFNYHCHIDLVDCQLVKSFIRPEAYNFEYRDPHHFHLKKEQYADALGHPVQWNGPSKQTIWNTACINHYICRSMEDYVNRLQKRVNIDLDNSTGYWDHFNRNDIYRPESQQQILKSNKILLEIKKECIKQFIEHIAVNNVPQDVTIQPDIRVVSFESFFEKVLGLEKEEGCLSVFEKEDNFIKILGVMNMNFPDILYLFHIKNNEISNIPFIIRAENSINSSYAYSLTEANESSEYFCLKSTTSNCFLSHLPQHLSNVIVDKEFPQEHEYIKLNEEYISLDTNILPERINTIQDFIAYLQKYSDKITYADFLFAFNQLDNQQKSEIFYSYPKGKLISWI